MAINKEELLFKKVFAGKASTDNDTAYFSETAVTNARPSVFSKDIWSEAHLIPDSGIGHITGSVNPGDFTASGVVKYYSASGFTAVAGADAGYSAGIKDWIPFNFGDGTTYNYVLLKNNGDRLFPGDAANNWTFDTEAGVLIFHDGNPSGVSSTTPPSMSAYVYIGNKLSDGIGDSTTSITGSLLGTASVAVSSSHSLTASSLENNLNYHLNSLTASSGIFFTASAPNNQYSIDYAKVLKANGLPEPTSGSLTITASGVRIDGDLTATGSVTLGGALSFNGFNFAESSTTVTSGSTQFGSGSTGNDIPLTTHQFTGSITVTGSGIFPGTNGTIDLGSHTKKFSNLYATNTFFGGVHEINLETEGLDQMQEGTVLTLKNGTLHPCKKEADPLVMGIVSSNSNFPIVLGAEPVLITGKIKEGDYIITSKIEGHGKGIDPKHIYTKQLFGKIIAQAIEKGNGRSHIIKAMIRKM